MATLKIFNDISIVTIYLEKWFQENLWHPAGVIQLGAIGGSYLIAWLLSAKIRQLLEKDIEKVRAHMHLILSSAHFAIVLRYVFWLLLVWFLLALTKKLALPYELLDVTLSFILAMAVARFASFYFKSKFWAGFVCTLALIFLSLRIFGLWDQTMQLLNSMTINIGRIQISMWNLIEAVVVFILLWIARGAANRFLGHWLATAPHMTYADRTLIQRSVSVATGALVVMIALRAAGVHMTAIAVTGGAFGVAMGIGLQKIGANMVSGMMLLIRKPIQQGDVVSFEKGFADARWGWVTKIGLLYVTVATRSGVLLLIPNEEFLTDKIEKLSFEDERMRLNIPFGISYASDLKKAITLAITAAMNTDRILKEPEPKCLVTAFGDSTVNLELRVWINDPKNGLASLKDAILLGVWDSFHANGIEIAFPQRDLHIKSAVPLRVLRDELQSVKEESA